MRTLVATLAVALVAGLGGSAVAHPLAPVVLDLREGADGATTVSWKTPLARPAGADVRPVLPAACEAAAPLEVVEEAAARVERGVLRCEGGWVGRTLGVDGLGASGTNAIVRVALADGRVFRTLLHAERTRATVPAAPARADVARDYLALGVEHLVTGLDHVLFVVALLLLVRGGRRLAWTITAFTAAHSVTLGAAVLGFVRVPQAPVEALIAATLVVLAAAIGSPRPSLLARRPALVAGGFGLLHGFGFAGALAETGLPADEIPLALLAFNVGIEAGQLAVVAAALALAAAVRAAGARWPASAPGLAAYAIGTLAASWLLERLGLA